jgi:hypothetical protein
MKDSLPSKQYVVAYLDADRGASLVRIGESSTFAAGWYFIEQGDQPAATFLGPYETPLGAMRAGVERLS